VLRSAYAYEELSYVPGLVRAFSPDEYDITCTCAYPFTNWTLRALRRARSPAHVFITQNGDWPAFAGHREYRLFGCEGLVCINPEYFERNRARWRSALIPNGVDTERFAPGPPARRALGLPADVSIVLMVSALIPSKRVVEAIRCVARVPGVALVVAGDGELRAQVDEAAARLLGERFRRVSVPHAEMPDLYRSADVLLHMSRSEPFGNVYLEALASGLPVVADDNSVSRWILEDQAELVDTRDEAAVAGAVLRAVGRRTAEMATARRALVERRYTWEAIAASYAAFFDEVLAADGSRRWRKHSDNRPRLVGEGREAGEPTSIARLDLVI
jgi:glycosyltransferase involved in cell wall biosynthesis